MNAHAWVRQAHRWSSMVFTATVVITSAGLAMKTSAAWVSYLPLAPLLLLLLTGSYLFVRPYVGRSREPVEGSA